MKTFEEILLSHFGCQTPVQLFNGYGIDLTCQSIISRAAKAYAGQYTGNSDLKFAMYLTGHDEDTIKQMYHDWLQSKKK